MNDDTSGAILGMNELQRKNDGEKGVVKQSAATAVNLLVIDYI